MRTDAESVCTARAGLRCGFQRIKQERGAKGSFSNATNLLTSSGRQPSSPVATAACGDERGQCLSGCWRNDPPGDQIRNKLLGNINEQEMTRVGGLLELKKETASRKSP